MEKKLNKKHSHSLPSILRFIEDPTKIMDSSVEVLKIENRFLDMLTLRVNNENITTSSINLDENAFNAISYGDKITIKDTEAKDTIVNSFNDARIGISEEALAKLFSLKNKLTKIALTLPMNPKFETGGEKVWTNSQKYSL